MRGGGRKKRKSVRLETHYSYYYTSTTIAAEDEHISRCLLGRLCVCMYTILYAGKWLENNELRCSSLSLRVRVQVKLRGGQGGESKEWSAHTELNTHLKECVSVLYVCVCGFGLFNSKAKILSCSIRTFLFLSLVRWLGQLFGEK